MGFIGKMKDKLTHNPVMNAAKGTEKRAEKFVGGRNPKDVDQMGTPDLPVKDTKPASDKAVNGSAPPGAEPPKPQLAVEGMPKAPDGRQPNLGVHDPGGSAHACVCR